MERLISSQTDVISKTFGQSVLVLHNGHGQVLGVLLFTSKSIHYKVSVRGQHCRVLSVSQFTYVRRDMSGNFFLRRKKGLPDRF